ncbi:MAG: lipopolysaccharide assembly protein LapA domain-containing protein [Candidatus Omnitrophota bacterium]
MYFKWFLVLLLLLILVVFTAQNYEVVRIHFLFWSFQTSRAIIIFLALLIGIIIGCIGCAVMKRRG